MSRGAIRGGSRGLIFLRLTYYLLELGVGRLFLFKEGLWEVGGYDGATSIPGFDISSDDLSLGPGAAVPSWLECFRGTRV